jgi:RNA polymerase sigma-70 factor (ECF subfamily)
MQIVAPERILLESEDNDHALMARIAMQDGAAYRHLVKRHLNFCVRFGERMLGSRQDAEDVAQDVCMKIWHEAPRWKPSAKFTTWLYRVLYNACIDHRRKVIPLGYVDMDIIPDPAQNADDGMIERQQSQSVQAALQRLNPRQRAALVMSYYEGIGNQEAADILGLGLGAFQQLLFRARASLKDELMELRLEKKNG